MTHILLVGADAPLLEGLAQSLGALGHTPQVVGSLHDARQMASQTAPLIAVISRALAAEASAEMLGIPLAPGGALILYRVVGSPVISLPPGLQRAVLADLTLPLERNRMVALVAHVRDRVRSTGRDRSSDPSRRMEL